MEVTAQEITVQSLSAFVAEPPISDETECSPVGKGTPHGPSQRARNPLETSGKPARARLLFNNMGYGPSEEVPERWQPCRDRSETTDPQTVGLGEAGACGRDRPLAFRPTTSGTSPTLPEPRRLHRPHEEARETFPTVLG